MGKIQIGRDKKRDYESVKFFSESVKPENEASDEQEQGKAVPQQPQQTEGQEPVDGEKPVEEKQAPQEKEVPVVKQHKKKGGKR